MHFLNTQHFSQHLDDTDVLKEFRSKFFIPQYNGHDAIYLLGNSLGCQPKQASVYIGQVMKQWQEWGVEGFFMGKQPWMNYHDELIIPLSKIIGALPHEVVVMNSLTVNIHLMLATFYQPNGKRNKIVCEAKAFCSDQYALETHLKKLGFDPDEIIIEVYPPDGEVIIREEDIPGIIAKHKDEVALVFFGGVNYYTGQVFDMKKIADAAHDAGAKVGFDLAHGAGNILLELHNWNVDFACWCSYKYLNSGPGAIGGAYIHERYHNDNTLQRFGGWWGYDKANRFKMQKGFDPVHSAEGWQLSTPSPLLYATHNAALKIFQEAGMKAIAEKGKLLSDYLIFLLNDINNSLAQPAIKILTPPAAKGCQVSMLMLKDGRDIFDGLSSEGVFADWREPDVIRVAPAPLYNTFEEVWQFAQILKKLLQKFNS